MFKKGDKIKYIGSHYHDGITYDKHYNFIEYSQCGIYARLVTDKGVVNGYNKEQFKLVKESNEILLEQFKEGLKAQEALINLGVLEYNSQLQGWKDVKHAPINNPLNYRLKLKEFKLLELSESKYRVAIVDKNDIQIGCVRVNFYNLKTELDSILEKEVPETPLLKVTAKGLKYRPTGAFISYKDVNELFNAMKEYL